MTRRSGNVLITGASTGIGAACALHLAARGMQVFAGVRDPAVGDALRTRSSSRITPVRIDVVDRASILAAAASIKSQIGETGLGGLINNAGTAIGGPLEVLPLTAIREQFEVNVIGVVAVTQAFLPLLRQGRGRVVNMGSIAGRIPVPLLGAYSMSKSALDTMTTVLRLELDRWGIDVSLIEPGAIATPIWQKSIHVAGALETSIPRDAWSLYSETTASVLKVIAEAEQGAIPAVAIARAVERALTARRPRPRYLVGADARIRASITALLPQRAEDALQRWIFKLPRRR